MLRGEYYLEYLCSKQSQWDLMNYSGNIQYSVWNYFLTLLWIWKKLSSNNSKSSLGCSFANVCLQWIDFFPFLVHYDKITFPFPLGIFIDSWIMPAPKKGFPEKITAIKSKICDELLRSLSGTIPNYSCISKFQSLLLDVLLSVSEIFFLFVQHSKLYSLNSNIYRILYMSSFCI